MRYHFSSTFSLALSPTFFLARLIIFDFVSRGHFEAKMQLVFIIVLAISSRILAQAPKIAVTGVQTGVNPNTGARPARMNINDLYISGGPAWSVSLRHLICNTLMFTLGTFTYRRYWNFKPLTRQMSSHILRLWVGSGSESWSYQCQLLKTAGIHGLPYEAYNGVGQVPGGARTGFCPHNVGVLSMY